MTYVFEQIRASIFSTVYSLNFITGPRLGDVVIDVSGVRKAFGDRLLINDLDFSLPKAGIVGVIGKKKIYASIHPPFRITRHDEDKEDSCTGIWMHLS